MEVVAIVTINVFLLVLLSLLNKNNSEMENNLNELDRLCREGYSLHSPEMDRAYENYFNNMRKV